MHSKLTKMASMTQQQKQQQQQRDCQACGERNPLSFNWLSFHNCQKHSTSDPYPTKPEDNSTAAKFKTKLCHHFMATGNCYFGAKCHFAHGEDQLRRTANSPPLIHPRHKTTLCQNELRNGTCKFGKGCIFIHKDDPEYISLRTKTLNHQNFLLEEASKQHNESKQQSWKLIQKGAASDRRNLKPSHIQGFEALFAPLNKIECEIQTNNFTPGTPLHETASVSYHDRRISAASMWGSLSPRVAVWEQRLRRI